MFLTDPARSRRQTRVQIVFAIVMVIALRLIVVLARDRAAEPPRAPVAPAPVAPAPAAVVEPRDATSPPLINEPLVKVVAASDAPVIAVASEHRVWISRDGGRTFASALPGTTWVSDLLVEPTGRVYVLRYDTREVRKANGALYARGHGELGIAELDGRERWRELSDGMVPLVARDGWIAGLGRGSVEIGQNAGDSWTGVPGATAWNPWMIALGERGAVRFLGSRTAKDDQLDAGLSVVVAHDGRPATAVWSMRLAAMAGVPSDETPCAGFAGQVLHLVTTDAKAGPSGTRLIRVDGNGKVRTRALADLVAGIVLDPGLTCEIAGNEHAAFLALDNVLFRLDTREPQISNHDSNEIRALAVDAHGDLVVLARRCVRRLYTGSSREDELVCGPAPP